MTRTTSMFIHDQQIAAKDAEIRTLRADLARAREAAEQRTSERDGLLGELVELKGQLSESRAAHAEAEACLAEIGDAFGGAGFAATTGPHDQVYAIIEALSEARSAAKEPGLKERVASLPEPAHGAFAAPLAKWWCPRHAMTAPDPKCQTCEEVRRMPSLASTQRQLEEARRAVADLKEQRECIADAVTYRHEREVETIRGIHAADIQRAVEAEREACAQIAAGYAVARPLARPTRDPLIIGRWEGEGAASENIARLIRARNAEQPAKEGQNDG